jgi:hypothetical protein
MNKKYIVRLTAEERKELENLVKKGKTQAYRIKYRTPLIPLEIVCFSTITTISVIIN